MQRLRAASLGAGILWAALTILLLLCSSMAVRADYVGGLDPGGDNYLSLRTGPGTKYRALRRLGPDTIVTVLDRDGAWRLIELDDGTRGWAHGDYILPGSPAGWDAEDTDIDLTSPPPPDDAPPIAEESAVPKIGHWIAYTNDRYGTSIEYPTDAFAMQPPPENDDGRSFLARSGRTRFIVFASPNVFDKTIEELRDDDIAAADDDNVTYKRMGPDWYVLSGYRLNDVFYRRTLLSDDGSLVNTFEITYPKTQKSVFDPVVARMARSFSAGGGQPNDKAPPAIDTVPPPDVVEPSDEAAVQIDEQPPEVALDSWRSPLEETLFAGVETPLFISHQAHGGIYETSAQYEDGELVVDAPANSGWAKVGLLSSDPLVWMDDFRDDAETRVTFTLDPQRTTGFGLALSQPGWGGVVGNDPGYPGVRFYWIRSPDGASASVEMHVDPHGTDDFWKGTAAATAPSEVTFILTPGKVAIALDGEVVTERGWPELRSGIGFRVYAFSHAAEVNLPAQMGLRSIAVARSYPTVPEKLDPAPGVDPLPTKVLFDGTPNSLFEPAATAGGNFDSFARYTDDGLVVDVPAGNSWGKTGFISAEPLMVLDQRAYETAMRLTLFLDQVRTRTFVLALSGEKLVEMWPSHNAWFTLSRRDDLGTYQMQINDGPYNDRVRSFPIAWFDAHWDGRFQFDISHQFACMRVPDGPSLCARMPTDVGARLYATILAHAPQEGEPTSLAIRQITRGLVTPPGLTTDRRWFFVDDDAFDPAQYLKDLGSLLN